MDTFLTVKQVSELLQLSTSIIFRKAKANLIPHYRLNGQRGKGGTLRFSRAELEAWLKSHHHGSVRV